MNLLNDPFVVGDRFHNHLSGRIFNIWFMIPKFAWDMTKESFSCYYDFRAHLSSKSFITSLMTHSSHHLSAMTCKKWIFFLSLLLSFSLLPLCIYLQELCSAARTLYVLKLLIAQTEFEKVGNFYLVSLVILAKAPTKVFKKGGIMFSIL
jgi:hypothetical protein